MPALCTRRLFPASLAVLLLFASAAAGAAQQKRPLDHDDYDRWSRISGQVLSADGRHVAYSINSEATEAVLTLKSLAGAADHSFDRGDQPSFSRDGRHLVFRVRPMREATEEARRNRVPAAQQPQDSMYIVDVATGDVVRVERVASFRMPAEAGGWLAYLHVRAPAQPQQRDTTQREQAQPSGPQKQDGSTLVVRNLATGEERRIEYVTDYRFSDDGQRLFHVTQSRSAQHDGVHVLDTRSGSVSALATGPGVYRSLTLDDAGRQAAFLTNRDTYAAEQPSHALYWWDGRAAQARAVAGDGTAGIPQGWWVSENAGVSFSRNGQRLVFGTAPRPAPAPRDTAASNEPRVVVDIWSWHDPLLQPQQLQQLQQERRRTYTAMADLRSGRVLQLATEDMPDASIALRGDGDFALGRSNLPYRQEVSWGESGTDFFLVDLRTGAREMLREYSRSNISVSPEGRYLIWWDGAERAWFTMDLRTRNVVDITASLPHPVHNELHDSPSLPGSYGTAGWLRGDERVLLYDNFDLWAVDPAGRAEPRSVTAGEGRRSGVRFRVVRLDRDELGEAFEPNAELFFSAFHQRTKDAGFFRGSMRGAAPQQLVMMPKSFGTPRRADDADVLLFTRSDFREFPDLWVSGPDFRDMRQLTEANPQQAEYTWGSAELVEWRSAGTGDVLQGVLYKPENFDPSRQYPMMVYFYERLSNNLHNYVIPAAGGSSINISFYVSRGYLVFTPDIPYRVGYPGESALHAVVPGVLGLVDRGFVDPARIGVQGHSWGGYQIAYMITKTDIFAAAEAGAPVSNMTSAYGGIRWESGRVRQFQYEQTQSRLGATLWDSPMRYIENSPLFWADKVNTPLLMMHNDEDGAVPWEQGIEYFVALRRLGKPVWMLNYNGEAHGLRQAHNRRDWQIRMQQFFDHYLMDAPPPVWMVHGVPATLKGETLGLDLVEQTATPVMQNGGGR